MLEAGRLVCLVRGQWSTGGRPEGPMFPVGQKAGLVGAREEAEAGKEMELRAWLGEEGRI